VGSLNPLQQLPQQRHPLQRMLRPHLHHLIPLLPMMIKMLFPSRMKTEAPKKETPEVKADLDQGIEEEKDLDQEAGKGHDLEVEGGVVGVLQPEVGVGTGEVGAGIEGEEDLGADHGIEGGETDRDQDLLVVEDPQTVVTTLTLMHRVIQ